MQVRPTVKEGSHARQATAVGVDGRAGSRCDGISLTPFYRALNHWIGARDALYFVPERRVEQTIELLAYSRAQRALACTRPEQKTTPSAWAKGQGEVSATPHGPTGRQCLRAC